MVGAAAMEILTDKRWLVMPAAVLLMGAILTVIVLDTVHRHGQQSRTSEFERRADEVVTQISTLLEDQQYLLMGMRSLYEGAGYVGRREFRGYLESIDMANSFPGVHAVTWIPRVPHHMVHEFTRSVRDDRTVVAEGYPDFELKPDKYAAEHHVVTYLYPMQSNRWIFGFDLSASAERLLTLEHARDTGELTATPPLERDMGSYVLRGFLMMLPVYGDSKPENLAQRRQHYRGMLSGIFRTDGLFAQFELDQFSAMSIRDVTHAQDPKETLSIKPFYRMGDVSSDAATLSRHIMIGDRDWQLSFSLDSNAYARLASPALFWMAALIAVVVSILCTLGAVRMACSRNEALRRSATLSSDLQLVNSKLQRASSDLRQFAYVTSQDMQTPVRTIDLSITLLEDALTSRMTPPVRENLNHLQGSSVRLHKLADDLLDFAKVDRETRQMKNVDLNQAMGCVQEQLKPLISDAGACITIGKLPTIHGDNDQLEKLLKNLLSNAIKYRSTERTLVVGVDASLVDDCWQIRFADNGIGIDARFHEKVFEPFHRLHRHDDIVGTGLGLRICKQIVECHEGQIYIDASSEAGSTFVVSLPADAQLERAA